MYEKIFGLSCVENHILAILGQRNEKIEYAYYDCAVPFKDLYTDLVLKGIKQEYFSLLDRIQEVLKKLGIIELVKIRSPRFDEIKQVICRCEENEYILMRVTPDFTKTKLLARGFRPDHFVYVRSNGNDFKVFNDIPERVVFLTASQLKEGYDGEYFRLSVKRKLNDEDIKYLWNTRKFKPEVFHEQNLEINNFEGIGNIGIKLRNLAGTYKLLRYRMIYYYGNYMNTEYIQEVMPRIEKMYAILEYYNLKSEISMDKYMDLFYKLWEADKSLMQQLKKEMECLKIVKRKN